MAQAALQNVCTRFRRRLRLMLIQYGALSLIFFCLVVAGLLMLADWYVRFSPDMRLLSLLTFLAAVAASYYVCVHRPLRRLWNDDEILGYMDRIQEDGGDALTALRDLSEPEGMREWDTDRGKEMVRASVRELEQKVKDVDVARCLRRKPIRRWWVLAGVVIAVYVVASFVPRDRASGASYLSIGARRMLFPFATVFWPQNTRLLVQEPESGWRVPVGEPLVVQARIEGEVPLTVDIVYRSESGGPWIRERMAVDPAKSEAMFTFKEMVEPLTFYCIGGDDRDKRRYRVTVAERPIITEVKATYEHPPYTRLPKTVVASGQLAGLEGTKVTLHFTASSPLSRAAVRLALTGEEPAEPVKAETLDGNRFSYSLMLTRSGTYTVHLVDTEGLTNGKQARYEIRVDPDNPPEVTLEEPLRDLILTASGKVRVKLKAKDDYNLTSLKVLLAPEGSKPEAALALSEERITGPFWDRTTTLHPVGEGEFDLDFLKEKDKGALKAWKIEGGAELELWVRAVDCNPTTPGVTETPKVRLTVLHPTDFMSEVVLTAKALMADARVGWFSAAGAFYDGRAWVREPKDELLEKSVEQQQTAERAAAALALRFPSIIEHMSRNRMADLFMRRRLDRIGSLIAELEKRLPAIGSKIAAGKPTTVEEAVPEKRKAKMAAAIRSVLQEQNLAAWKMRLLYNRLADWVALQSVLLKTRRMEELQTEVNAATQELVKRTLGREARELEEDEVRMMKEVANQQDTVYQMDVAVEKALAQLVYQADTEGRTKIVEALGRALLELRDNQINDKLKRAAMAILDARGEVVRKDQRLVLHTLSLVNRGLILAGEHVPEDPSDAAFAAAIEDPRDKVDIREDIASDGAELDKEIYKRLDKVRLVTEAKADTLDETLSLVFRDQEDVRNRTRFVHERLDPVRRYLFLRTGLTALRQAKVVALLEKGMQQTKTFGAEVKSDPTVGRARTRLAQEVGDHLARAEEAKRLVAQSRFGRLVTDVQTQIHRGARDLRVYIQARDKVHKLWQDRTKTNFLDPFKRPYLLRGENLRAVIEAARNLEWALVLQAGSQREAAILAQAKRAKTPDPAFAKAVADVTASARRKNTAVAALIRKVQQDVARGVRDSTDPERANEAVLPSLKKAILDPLQPGPFEQWPKAFEAGEYEKLAMTQDGLRRGISDALVTLYDLFDARVPPKPPTVDPFADEHGVATAGKGGVIDYEDEKPNVVAGRIEKEGKWIDVTTGDPEVRKRLIERLRTIGKWDPRYARLQSAYFQAIAQGFQAKAKKREDEKEEQPRP